MKKNYILDTNCFIYEPGCLFLFEDNDLYIAPVTLREITQLKNKDGEVGYSARRAKGKLRELRGDNHNFKDGIPLGKEKGLLRCITETDFTDFLPGMSKDKNDDLILAAASWLTKNSELDTILVTDDVDMCFLADLIGVKTEPFRNKRVSAEDMKYTGRRELLLSPDKISEFYKRGELKIDVKCAKFTTNEFVLLKNETNLSNTALARYDGEKLVKLKYLEADGKDIHPSDIIPRNNGQRFMQEALLAPAEEIPLVILSGPAGTAKTFMTLACGLECVLNRNEYRQILITRANVSMDETYGFLPGTEEEKVSPNMRPFMDNIEHIMGTKDSVKKDGKKCPSAYESLIDTGVLRAEAMQYMRGRSITNTYVIIDEAQNCTPNQILSIVSRAGEGCKIILLGDPEQIDNKLLNPLNNGLVFAIRRFKGSKLCSIIGLKQKECVRSPLAAEAAIRLAPDYKVEE